MIFGLRLCKNKVKSYVRMKKNSPRMHTSNHPLKNPWLWVEAKHRCWDFWELDFWELDFWEHCSVGLFHSDPNAGWTLCLVFPHPVY